MKSIVKRIVMYMIPLLAMLAVVDLVSLTDVGDGMAGRLFFATGYRHIGTGQIAPAIRMAQAESGHTRVVLGDSVCAQILGPYRDENDEYLLLGTNAAITMDGQYILARLFLESHPEAKDIYLVLLPGSLEKGYDSPQSYSYLVEPFGRMELLSYLSENTLDGMRERYGSIFLKKDIIRLLDGSSINNKLYLYWLQAHKPAPEHGQALSDEAEYYLKDLERICRERGVVLHLLPSPVCNSDGTTGRIDKLKGEVREAGLSDLFGSYFDCITLYPPEMFPDGTHFGAEYADPGLFSECIADLQNKSGELDGLKY